MMNNSIKDKDTKKNIGKVPRYLARNSLYSILTTYSGFALSLFTSFFLARIITIEEWSSLIITTAFITIINSILSFLPLGLPASLNYYIPHYKSSNQMKKLKSFLLKLLLFKSVTVIIFFILTIFIITFFNSILIASLGDFTNLLYLLSPLIIIGGFNHYLSGFNLGFGLFKLIFYLKLITNIVLSVGYIIFFLFVGDV